MTVEAQILSEQHPGDGVNDEFEFAFRIDSAAELVVTLVQDATLTTTLQALTTHYTVAIDEDDGTGTITMLTAPAVGYTLDVRPVYELLQPTRIGNQGRFLPEIHEAALDRLTSFAQYLYRLVRNSVRLPDIGTQSAELTPRASWLDRFLYMNAAGELEPAAAISITTLTRSIIGALLNPQTKAEQDIGITPANKWFLPGNVERYGADPLGVIDSSAAFQAALDQNFAGGAPAHADGGNFRIEHKVRIRPRGGLRGAGKQTVLLSYCVDEPCLDFTLAAEASALGPHGVLLEHFRLDGANHTGTGGGLHLESSGHALKVHSVWSNAFSDAGQYGISCTGNCYYVSFDTCNVQNCDIGVFFDGTGGGVNNNGLEGCKITQCRVGVRLNLAPSTTIRHCQIEQCSERGIDCASDNCSIDDCWLEQNVLADIRFDGCTNSHARHIYTFRTLGDTANKSVHFEAAVGCSVSESKFNNRDDAHQKAVHFDVATFCRAVDCRHDLSSVLYAAAGGLGNNLVLQDTSSQGRNYNTQYPLLMQGGIWLPQTAPLNVQDGTMYSAGEGVIQRVNSADYIIPALQRKMITRAAAPATGTWAVGDIAWNSAPTAGGFAGWICTVAGTPGTWKTFGVISA